MPLLRIRHSTLYRHGTPALGAWQSLRLQPRSEPNQECLDFDLDLHPRPSDLATRTDYFGNTLHVFSVRGDHDTLRIQAESTVRRAAPALPETGRTPSAEVAAQRAVDEVQRGEFLLEQYLLPSPLVPRLPAFANLALEVDRSLPAMAWLECLGKRFRDLFRFDPAATIVSTPVDEVLRLRRGVCQDFAHVYIGCARAIGLPAAYVSGYLLTDPPPGKPRLEGADAMHAWVAVYVAGVGWIDYDPTNRCFAGETHVVVARGRDYSDVSPIRGIFNGGGAHALQLAVTVAPLAEAPLG
jgi:transglutaminase-like putative cysteine protease